MSSSGPRTDRGAPGGEPDDPVAVLRRWQDAGGVWRVVARTEKSAVVALLTCTGGEEVDRLTSGDPELLAFLTGRTSSEE